ncbi:MAG: hypothetical protein B6U75_04130 [Desulfurococcales archaeon ex4484_217_1]|nr:MAG: hypothetical protein B6U75_04130 [Desulfurococcales archaeon ex4484_217_1]
MVGLHKDNSDIDIVVYGTRESFKVADVLKYLFEKGVLSSFSEEQYRNLYVFRKAYETMDFKTFITPVKYTIDCVKIIESKTKYPIKSKELVEVVSFRGRFCQQAFKGENVIVRGKVEAVLRNNEISHYRVVIGGSPKDYMVCEGLLK